MPDCNVTVDPRDYRIGEGDGVLSIIAEPLGSIAPSSTELELYSPIGQPIAAARSQPSETAWRNVELEICNDLNAAARRRAAALSLCQIGPSPRIVTCHVYQ